LAFCSEYGFVGAFNHQIITRAIHELSADSRLFVIGTRGSLAAKESDTDIEWQMPMPTNVAGIPEAARRIADALYRRIEASEIAGVDLVFGVQTEEGAIIPRQQTLLPLDFSAFETPTNAVQPLTTLAPTELLEQLVAEYFYGALTLAATESLVVINQARLAAMDQAHHNIEAKHEELLQAANTLGQEQTTTELQDIITGAQAALSRR
jgi:F-type H+-transporting ATPase subunit gamma